MLDRRQRSKIGKEQKNNPSEMHTTLTTLEKKQTNKWMHSTTYVQRYISTYHVMCQNTSAHGIILGMAIAVFCKVAKCIAPQKTNAIILLLFEMGTLALAVCSCSFLHGNTRSSWNLQTCWQWQSAAHHHCCPHYLQKHQWHCWGSSGILIVLS